MLIKFVNRWVKRAIFSSEADLIGTGMSISEHLTGFTQNLISSARAIVGGENVWVFKNSVFAQSGGKELKVRNSDDLKRLKSTPNNYTSNVKDVTTTKNTTTTTTKNTTDLSQPLSTVNLNNDSTTAPAASFPNNVPLGTRHGSQDKLPHNSYAPSRFLTRPQGRPSRNGRGGSRHYNFYYPRHHNTYNPDWKNSMYY